MQTFPLILNSANKIKSRALKRKHLATIFGTVAHEKINMQRRKKYASISWSPEHENLKAQQRETKRENYANIFGTPEYENIKRTMKGRYTAISRTQNNITMFRMEIAKCSYFICIVCNRCLYMKSVFAFNETKYDVNVESFCYENVDSYDGCQYICKTCDTKLKKKKISCQASWNKLQLFQFHDRIPCLKKLERVIIGKRIFFPKIIIMPKGHFSKLKGATCIVTIEAETICNMLPRGIDSNGLLLLKLKRKLCYRGHLFESVRPDVVQAALNYLKQKIACITMLK